MLSLTVVGVLMVALGPCTAHVAAEAAPVRIDLDGLGATVTDLRPYVVRAIGTLLAALGAYRLARSLAGEGRRLLFEAAGVAVLATVVFLVQASVVALGVRVVHPALGYAGLGAFVALALYARGLQEVSMRAGLPTPRGLWAATAWLSIAAPACWLGLLTTAFLRREGAADVLGGALVLVSVCLWAAALATFLLAASWMQRTLRMLARARDLRLRSEPETA